MTDAEFRAKVAAVIAEPIGSQNQCDAIRALLNNLPTPAEAKDAAKAARPAPPPANVATPDTAAAPPPPPAAVEGADMAKPKGPSAGAPAGLSTTVGTVPDADEGG